MTDGPAGFFINPEELPENHPIKQMIEERDRRHLQVHDFTNHWHRMLAEDLTYEQVNVLRLMLSTIADSQNPAAIANWYEGQTGGVLATRRIRCNEGEDDQVPLIPLDKGEST